MPTYEKREGGKIRAKIRVAPFPMRSRTFERKEDARLWAEPIEADLKKKKRAGLLEEEIYTYADLIDDYFEYQLPKRNDIQAFKQRALWWRREIGSKALAQIRTFDIADKRDKLGKEEVEWTDINGRPVGRTDKLTNTPKLKSPATVNRYLSVLSAMCRYNINKRGWLRVNPVVNLDKETEPKERVRFLSDEEKDVLLTACREHLNEMLFPIVLFGLCTGARRGEILKLKFSDLNPQLTEATLHDTKNGETRNIHITPVLRPCVEEHLVWLSGHYGKALTGDMLLFP